MPETTSRIRKIMTWLAPVLIVAFAAVLIVIAQRDDDAGSFAGSSGAPSASPTQQDGETGADDGADADAIPADDPTDAAGYAAEYAKHRAQDMARRDADDPLAVGALDAPVVVVVYSDYQCPYCAMWAERTEKKILDEYVDDGSVRIEWRDVNVFGPASKQAAKAAYAAGLQGKFRTFHDSLFAGGEHLPESELTAEALVERALNLALDADQFQADMESEETEAAVQANEDEGIGLGAFSTPSFMINGIPIAGAQPTEIFTTIIDNELAAVN